MENFKERIWESVEFNLTYTLSNLARAYELLELYRYKEILDNIIYVGLVTETMRNKLEGSGRKDEVCNKILGTEIKGQVRKR